MKVRMTKEADGPEGVRKVGDEIEHPDAFRLIELGLAEAADDEATQKHAEFKEYQARVLARRPRRVVQPPVDVKAKTK